MLFVTVPREREEAVPGGAAAARHQARQGEGGAEGAGRGTSPSRQTLPRHRLHQDT